MKSKETNYLLLAIVSGIGTLLAISILLIDVKDSIFENVMQLLLLVSQAYILGNSLVELKKRKVSK